MSCQHPNCLILASSEVHKYQCDICNTPFCSDHGTAGGDREGREGEVAQAYPSQCWKCGGFNADE